MEYKSYTVAKNDTLSKIAREFGTTVSAIQKANASLIKDVNVISKGWVLKIPVPKPSKDYAAIGEQFELAIADIRNLPSVKKLSKMMGG